MQRDIWNSKAFVPIERRCGKMEIYRGGRVIKLTEQEVFLAYQEQEKIYDMENVRENMETYLDSESCLKLKENPNFIEEAAYLLRIYLDKNNMDYGYALTEAIKDAAEFINNGKVGKDD